MIWVLLGLVGCVAGCGGANNVKTTTNGTAPGIPAANTFPVNTLAIRSYVTREARAEVASRVDCPERIPAQIGSSFQCTVYGADGWPATVTLIQKDAQGGISSTTQFMDEKRVTRAVRSQWQQEAKWTPESVHCPEIATIQPGTTPQGNSYPCLLVSNHSNVSVNVWPEASTGQAKITFVPR